MAYGTMSIGNAGFTKKFISTLFLLMHPVGTPYASENPTSPAELYGGTWERIEDCTIWGASDTHPAGTTIEAGLPNVEGYFGFSNTTSGAWTKSIAGTGPFVITGKGNTASSTQYEIFENSTISIDFSLARANSIYGNSATVQPPAYCMYIWRRVA